jgi:hypothetical protein
VLASVPFKPEAGRVYCVELSVDGDKLALSIDGKALASATDATFAYGMSGLRLGSAGRMAVDRFAIVER